MTEFNKDKKKSWQTPACSEFSTSHTQGGGIPSTVEDLTHTGNVS